MTTEKMEEGAIDDTAGEARGPPPSTKQKPGVRLQKLVSIKDESSGPLDFLQRLIACCLCGAICCGVIILVIELIPLALLIVGAVQFHQCPAQRFITIWMVVMGAVLLVVGLFGGILRGCCISKSEDETKVENKSGTLGSCFGSIINLFIIAWFITGSVWVYRTFNNFQSDDPDAADYCNAGVYWFSFVLITVNYILIIGFMLVCCCVTIIVTVCVSKMSVEFSSAPTSEEPPEESKPDGDPAV